MGGFYEGTNNVELLKARVEELARIRQGFVTHLGSSLYEATRDMPDLRWGRESLYDGIALCDKERERMLRLIDEAEKAASTVEPEPVAPIVDECVSTEEALPVAPSAAAVAPVAGEEDGAEPERPADPTSSVAQVPAAQTTCPSCGAPVEPQHKFCMTCGYKLQ